MSLSKESKPASEHGAAYRPPKHAAEMKVFERLLPTEHEDIQEMVQGILRAQKRVADEQHRPLGRGTHTKGIALRGKFTVLDLETEIHDPVLRDRLRQDLFAKPGTYDATIRFANAASIVNPDYTPDVRAVSFAVHLPNGKRHDFSLNNATTFPINDAHEFAVLMRLLAAATKWQQLVALTTLKWSDLLSLGKIQKRGKAQYKNSVHPYQRFRYFSGVPFRHGPNEAVKYCLTSRRDNPAPRLRHERNMLRDELIRHVETDKRMSEFDFGIQFLDSDAMRDGRKQRDDIYWVENASVEWPERQAPFHIVGRLELVRDSVLSDDEERQFYIDVTEHSTAESHPLGSINRARWFGESASRKARLGLKGAKAVVHHSELADVRGGAPLPAAAPRKRRSLGDVELRSVARYVAVLVVATVVAAGAAMLGTMLVVETHYGQLPKEKEREVLYRNKGWGDGLDAVDRQTFYYTPQGAGLEDVRYSWFANLELPWGPTRIADPSEMRRFGFLVDPPTPRNPDQLPVGFTRHFDSDLHEEMLDITCAACHTGQLEITRNHVTRALRIDGGQANHAFTDADVGEFVTTLTTSMLATALDPEKFDRFSRRVLGSGYPQGKSALHSELSAVGFNLLKIGLYEKWHRLSPTREGYGRTDALARIGNTVFGQNLGVAKNYKVGNAPVSYPPIWNIWKFDWVQYNASVSQPMARNIAEAMGVGSKYTLADRYGNPLPVAQRFRSTAFVDSLDRLEKELRRLTPPDWPADLFGPINQARADSGEALFKENCQSCHGPHIAPAGIKLRDQPLKKPDEPEWIVATLCASDVGTDSMTAANFARARVDISKTGMTAEELRRLARTTTEQWIQRDSTWLASEIKRLTPFKDSVSQLGSNRQQLATLRSSQEQTLSQIDPKNISLGQALAYVGHLVREQAYNDAKDTAQQQRAELDGFGALDLPQIMRGYESRPLQGIWATPPFLHNGSVPSIYFLLSPYKERPPTFPVGSHEFDPDSLGLNRSVKGYRTFDTSKPGNSNWGHLFDSVYTAGRDSGKYVPGYVGRFLRPNERLAIIEYLKRRNDDVDGDPTPTIPHQCVEP
jgi:mono/diheme cytochrome c family protein